MPVAMPEVRVRILAYILSAYEPERSQLFLPNVADLPNKFRGFFPEVIIEVDMTVNGVTSTKIVNTYIDADLNWQTFEEGQAAVFAETGVWIEPLPKDQLTPIWGTGLSGRIEGAVVCELEPNQRTRAELEKGGPYDPAKYRPKPVDRRSLQ